MEALKGLYHADKQDERSFIENFTIRIKEFHLIIDNLLQQKKKPLQHFLITGKRGMGKSTLLRRVYIEASRSPLNEKLIAVRLGAEQYRLSRLFKLWEMVIEHLGEDEPVLLQKKKVLEKSRQYEESLVFIVIDHLTETGKTLLLLIDNFDQFIEKIPSKDQHAFREDLILYPIQVIGNTVFYNEHFKSYNNPFFDFFKPIHLGNLDKKEADGFIKSRAIGEGIENFDKIYEHQKGKINALRILSGGVPRTLLILLSIVSRKNTGDAVDYLHEMIEQVTPLYQDRMKALSAQQQEIIHNLAMRWDRTPVKDLAVEMRIPSKSISAQLVQLEKSGYIKKLDIPGRNHYYEIEERFFNIWLLMSEAAPFDTKRVIWLTKWLDAFYSNNELKGFAKFCQTELRGIKPGNRFLIAQALSESKKLERVYKKKFINEVVEDLKDKMSEVKTWADNYNKKLTEEEIVLLREIKGLIDAEYFEVALNRLNKLEAVNEISILNTKAYVYSKMKDIDNAEKYYLIAVELGDTEAMYNLGYLLWIEKNDIAGAEKYFKMAAEPGDTDAMASLANLYFDGSNVSQKRKAFELSSKVVDLTKHSDIELLFIHAKILLWNEMAKEASSLITDVMKGALHTEENMIYISEALQYFLVFKQKQFLYKLFLSNPEWIDRYKPVYYALLLEIQDEHLKEYLKMASELEEPVKAIHDFVIKEQKRLGI